MPSLLHLLEVSSLAGSGLALALAAFRHEPARYAKSAGALALSFAALFLIKTMSMPTIRYPETGSLRTLYLTLLALHAILAPIGFTLGGIALQKLRRGQEDSFRKWLRRAAPFWLISAAAGTISAVLLWFATG